LARGCGAPAASPRLLRGAYTPFREDGVWLSRKAERYFISPRPEYVRRNQWLRHFPLCRIDRNRKPGYN